MAKYRFDIHEDGTVHSAEHDYSFYDEAQVRREAVIAGTDIAREVFSQGEVREVVVDVSRDNAPIMSVKISLTITHNQASH
jgi:hypothetical protein